MSDPIIDFFKAHGCKRLAYLGDGVYVGDEGYQAWLLTQRGDEVHCIALDAQAQSSLINYLRPEPSRPEKEDSD